MDVWTGIEKEEAKTRLGENGERKAPKVSLKLKCDDGWVGWEVGGIGGGRRGRGAGGVQCEETR